MDLFIYCAGGFGREVMDVARRLNAARACWSAIHFLDDVCETATRYDARVFRFEEACARMREHGAEAVVASGEPAVRARLGARLREAGFALGCVVDTSTVVAPTAQLAPGVIVTPLCSISSDARLQANASVNTMSIVGHDVEVGENSVISSMVNLGGGARIGRDSYVGMGALVKEGVSIGSDTIIGMGSVVYQDIPDGVIALGNPARPMRRNEDRKVFK